VLRAAEALIFFAHGAQRACGDTIPSTRPGAVLSTFPEPRTFPSSRWPWPGRSPTRDCPRGC
jgi:hypothetical protein